MDTDIKMFTCPASKPTHEDGRTSGVFMSYCISVLCLHAYFMINKRREKMLSNLLSMV